MSVPEDRRSVFLRELGIGPVWVRRDDRTTVAAETEDAAAQPAGAATPAVLCSAEQPDSGTLHGGGAMIASAAPASEIARMDWTQLEAAVSGCVKCGLCRDRTKTVFGVGDQRAKWLFIGEGPGRNEDLRGEPFVGQAGKLLDNMLLSLGVRRGENAYIANVVKCRPTDASGKDRPPTPEEAAACLPYLERQIALIQPSIIVALGKTAAISLLKLDPETPVSRLRGTVHRYQDLPLVVTYHPAYLLRSMGEKKKAWMDLCLAMSACSDSA